MSRVTTKKPRIEAKEFEAFLNDLPDGLKKERYNFLDWLFSIPHALFVIQRFEIAAEVANRAQIEQMAKAHGVGYPKPKPGQHSFSLFDRGLDDEWIEQLLADPEQAKYPLQTTPIIFLEQTFGKGKDKQKSWLLIDGGHRLRIHYLCERENLSVYMIPETYAPLIKI